MVGGNVREVGQYPQQITACCFTAQSTSLPQGTSETLGGGGGGAGGGSTTATHCPPLSSNHLPELCTAPITQPSLEPMI